MTELMKEWQKGYAHSFLTKLEELFYTGYNKYTLSPFTAVKKNTIADLLHKGELKTKDGFAYAIREVKAKSAIKTHDHLVGHRLPGEMVINKIGLTANFDEITNAVVDLIGTLQMPVDRNIWVEVFAEDEFMKSILKAAGFRYVTSKVMSTAEIISIWLLDSRKPRVFAPIAEEETVNIRMVNIPDLKYVNTVSAFDTMSIVKVDPLIEGIEKTLNELKPEFEVHYSNYNFKKTWSALSLRGFSPDIRFIEKPSEMNEKWWAEHKDEKFEIQDTELMHKFPEVQEILNKIPGKKERVRFMKLAANNGALHRHTDLVDVDSGVAPGKIMRLHIPIITNPDVTFYSWKFNGECDSVTMEKGTCWYLDTRKPHAAVNKGTTDRIHLVIDVFANFDLIRMMMTEEWSVSPAPEPHELPFDPYTNPNGKDPYDAD